MVSRATQVPQLPELGFDRSESLSSAISKAGLIERATQAVSITPVSVRRKGNPVKRIDRVLPTELLDLICNHLPTADVCAFRRVNRSFYDAARTAFSRRIDGRSFAITCWEMQNLEGMLMQSGCGPYMHTLRIDTGVVCHCQLQDWRIWAQRNRRSLRTTRCFADFDRVRNGQSGCALALRSIVRMMPNLQAIELAVRQRSWSTVNVQRMGGFSTIQEYVEPYFAATRWGSWRALDALVRAFGERIFDKCKLPKPREILLNGLFTADALPNSLRPAAHTRLFDHVTSCSLTIAQTVTGPAQAAIDQRHTYLPAFLEMLPPTLEELSLEFPKDNASRPPLPAFGHAFALVYFSDAGLDALLDKKIHFPMLHSLHIASFSLAQSAGFQRFLQKHTATLRCLSLTTFALTVRDWKPFLDFFRKEMKLERFHLDSQLTEEERVVQDRLWEYAPMDQRVKRDDYRGIATEMLLNGRRIFIEETGGDAAGIEQE